uniref:Uncharacterized protein n=1 Tax=Siphoviridae sp. ctgaY24 TaxID=2827911 RepID=A0A8S5SAH1_9CAUD|nr:MAG TPA: hypothetical protein [Siphoviridae sp. ctgaY24]DAW69471.1 MAG TPA: hypothetical protein [Caudoviricetes sp.]
MVYRLHTFLHFDLHFWYTDCKNGVLTING